MPVYPGAPKIELSRKLRLVLSGDQREGPVLGEERAAALPAGRGVLVRRGRPSELVQIAVDQEAGESARMRS